MPISDTGTAANGISVARQFCRNRNTTRNTSAIASSSVITTSRIETLTKRVVSYTTECSSPGGKACFSRAISADTRSAVASALALGCRKMPTSVAVLPLTRPMNS